MSCILQYDGRVWQAKKKNSVKKDKRGKMSTQAI